MAILTNRQDVINNFIRYHGRQPNASELAQGAVIDYLTTKSPQQVEQLLAKDSPITHGLVWADYQKQQNPQGGSTQPGTSISQPPQGSGISQTMWDSLDSGSKTALSAIWDVISMQASQNKPIPVNLTTQDLQNLLQQATQDPLINQKYGTDLANISGAEQNLGIFQKLQDQFKQETENLSETEAAAGRAYSGFRGEAKQRLGQEQQGIIESTRKSQATDRANRYKELQDTELQRRNYLSQVGQLIDYPTPPTSGAATGMSQGPLQTNIAGSNQIAQPGYAFKQNVGGDWIQVPQGTVGSTATPTSPSSTQQTPTPTQPVQTPQATQTPKAPTATVTKATLVNPKTGQKVVVDSGSGQAQNYFGQGYVLYTGK